MKMNTHFHILFLLILISVSPKCIQSWDFFSLSTKGSSADTDNYSQQKYPNANSVAEFSIDGFRDEKGMKLIENAKNKLDGWNSCWQYAYHQLFANCSQILAVEEKKKRFAWHLSDCFQKDSGRPPFPNCDINSPMFYCLKELNDIERNVFLEFSLETNSICYQLQSHSFTQKLERLVNDLKDSAKFTTDQLEVVRERMELLSKSSDQIHETLNTIDYHVQDVAQITNDVKGNMNVLSHHTQAIYKQSKEMEHSQYELRQEQVKMNDKLKEGMDTIHDAFGNLGKQVDNLRNETVEIEKQIGSVGEAMSKKMQNLQNSADEIEDKAGKSLDKQQLLVDGQSVALKGLQILTEFQSEALEESRSALQSFAEFGRKQQEELLQSFAEFGRKQQEELVQRQEQIKQVHDHLIENSKSILSAQEAFESKQDSMFIALDKLFALHNAMLRESRMIKSFFIYFMSIFVIYMLTNTKQTYAIRARLYIGLIAAFAIEVVLHKSTGDSIQRQTWPINLVRMVYVVFSLSQFLHAIFTYRDFEVLTHRAILEVNDKVNVVKELLWETDDDEINWSEFVEDDLLDEVDKLEDPDFFIPEEVKENSISSSTSLTRKYDLRSRNRYLQHKAY